MGNLKIVYDDEALGASKNAVISSTGESSYSHPQLLVGESMRKTAITLERNCWLLSGDYKCVEPTDQIAFWSRELSNNNCLFETPPTISVRFTNPYTSLGITLGFSIAMNKWCSELEIKWYGQHDELLDSKVFYPDNPNYYCENTVERYYGVDITFYRTSTPYTHLNVESIVFGITRIFGADEVRNAELVLDGDILTDVLPSASFKWTLNNREPVDYIFQSTQPVHIYDGNNFLCTTYIDSSNRLNKRLYDIKNIDAIGILDKSLYNNGAGKRFTGDTLAKDELLEILNGEFILELDSSYDAETLTGYIPNEVTKKEAIRQICFALGACVSTMGTNGIIIRPIQDSDPIVLDDREIFDNTTVETTDKVTKLRMTWHYLVDGIEQGDVDIGGELYTEVTGEVERENETLVPSDKENVVEIKDMTLVNQSNVDRLADLWYNHKVLKREELNTRIILGNRNIGDLVTIPTYWETNITGNIQSMTIRLSNMTVADIQVV